MSSYGAVEHTTREPERTSRSRGAVASLLLVPALLARMHARAAAEPSVLDEPHARPILRDGHGQLLAGRHGALTIFQCVELADGRDGIDIFACAERSCSLPYVMLADALELLRLCTHECCPGAQSVIHVLGERGTALGSERLSERTEPDCRPSAPIGIVRAAAKAGKPTVHFGGAAHDVLRLLGEEEVRAIQAASAQAPTAASPPQPQPKSPPPQPPPSKPGGRLTAQATPTAKPLAPIGVAPAGQQPDSDAGAGKQRRGSVITGQAKRPPKNR